MNVIVENEQQDLLTNLDIDIIQDSPMNQLKKVYQVHMM